MRVRTTTTVWPELVHSVSMYIGPGAERARETERGAIDSPQGKGVEGGSTLIINSKGVPGLAGYLGWGWGRSLSFCSCMCNVRSRCGRKTTGTPGNYYTRHRIGLLRREEPLASFSSSEDPFWVFPPSPTPFPPSRLTCGRRTKARFDGH